MRFKIVTDFFKVTKTQSHRVTESQSFFRSLSLSKGQTFAFDRLRHPENYAA